MEIKINFKLNQEYRLIDQVREVLRYYHFMQDRTVLLFLDIAVYKISECTTLR